MQRNEEARNKGQMSGSKRVEGYLRGNGIDESKVHTNVVYTLQAGCKLVGAVESLLEQ